MLKMELNRIGTRPIYWFLIAAGLVLALIPVIETWPQNVTEDYYFLYPRSAYVSWMYFVGSTFYIYSLVFPLLSALAYSDAYAEDYNTGIIKNILTKVEKKKYLLTRYSVNFFVGGFVAVFPLVVNFIGQMAAYPLIENNYYFGMVLVTENSFWPDLFYSHPLVYVILRVFLVFLLGGMLASLGLAFSTVVKNRYIVLVFPFIVVMGFDVLISTLGKPNITLLFLGNLEAGWELVAYLFVGIFGSIIWFYLLGDKNETI